MIIRTLALISLLGLSGCATLSNQPQQPDAQEKDQAAPTTSKAQTPVQPEPEPLPPASFEPETLYDIIVAEMAGKESRLELTLGNYLKQANRTRDTGIISRAMRIAKYMRAHQATLDAAELWLEIEPSNMEALETASVELIRVERFDRALDYMDKILAAQGEANFDFLVHHARELEPAIRSDVIAAVERLLKKYPGDAQLWFTHALLAEQNEQYELALGSTRKAIAQDPEYISAKIAQAKLLQQLSRPEEAIAFMQKAVNQHSDHKRLRVAYARLLILNKKLEDSQKQFRILVEKYPSDADLLLSLALISWENGLNDDARKYLNKLIDSDRKVDEAYTYLGQIEAAEENFEQAIEHYQQVGFGAYFGTARIQMALLTYQQGDLSGALEILREASMNQPPNRVQFAITASDILMREEQFQTAMDELNTALEDYPSDKNLLYSRAMVAERMDRVDLLEQDLRAILESDPNNAMALNALGYTLADRTDRYDEAFDLISRAYELEPNDAAVIDSMGWIHYRLGNYDKALQYLRKAYSRFDDHEIAAHYGEVLWVTGEQDRALKIWRKALDENPDSRFIDNVKQRFELDQL